MLAVNFLCYGFTVLIVDVICVFFEIMFYDRVITPSFSQKTQAGTLYVPSNYVCADSSSVKSSALLTECCKEYQLHAGEFSQFKNVEACYLAHNNKTVLVDAHSSSSSGSAHRRMLLSAAVHGPAQGTRPTPQTDACSSLKDR